MRLGLACLSSFWLRCEALPCGALVGAGGCPGRRCGRYSLVPGAAWRVGPPGELRGRQGSTAAGRALAAAAKAEGGLSGKGVESR